MPFAELEQCQWGRPECPSLGQNRPLCAEPRPRLCEYRQWLVRDYFYRMVVVPIVALNR